MTTVDISTVGPTALHAWLVIAEAIKEHGMPAPAEVKVYDGTDPDGPKRLITVDLHTVADAEVWAEHLGLWQEPFVSPWAIAFRPAAKASWGWSVRCMTDRSARVARPQADEAGA